MKVKRIVFYLIAMLAIISCSEDNTSNDLNSNDFLKNRQIVDLDKLSLSEQRVYFKSLEIDDKLSIWNNKISNLITTSNDANIRSYLNSLLEDINNKNLSNGIDHEEYELFWKQKLEVLITEYDWTEQDIYFTFTTLYTVKFNESLNKTNNQLEVSDKLGFAGVSEGCDCRWGGMGCLGESCNDSSSCPADRDDELGCGFLWLQSCTGACDY